MKKKVVIIGHSYLSRLSLIRAVAQIGCEVTVVVMTSSKQRKPSKPIDGYSCYVNRLLFCDRKNETALVSLLTEKCIDLHQKVVLIPDGDDVVATIDNHKDILKEHFFFPHINKEPYSMICWMDKSRQKIIAKEIGLNTTNDTIIRIVDGKYIIPDTISYPCFCKPLATMNGGKGGMGRCNDYKELDEALKYITDKRNKTESVLIEDFKQIETEYALLGFSDGNDVVIPGVLQFLTVSKRHKGIALQGRVRPVKELDDLMSLFKQLVLKIGFVGIFDIDFFQSDGLFYFCELNLRYGGSGYAITQMGVNLPAMMVKHFYGESTNDMRKSIMQEAVYVNDRMCIEDWYEGHITLKDFRQYLKMADIRFVSDDKDSQPEKAFNREFRKLFGARLIKNMIEKLRK